MEDNEEYFSEKLAKLILQPKKFFEREKKNTKSIDALKYFVGAAIVVYFLIAIKGLSKLPSIFGGIDVLSFFIIITVLIVALFIFAAISQVLGKLFFGVKGSYRDTLRVYLYVGSIGIAIVGVKELIIDILPPPAFYIVFALISLYLFYVVIVGLSIFHKISLLRAFLMSIAAGVLAELAKIALSRIALFGIAYLLLFQLPGQMGKGSLERGAEAQTATFCIENVWNESTAIKFTLTNCGTFGVTGDDFAKTSYYVDNMKTMCTANLIAGFNVGDVRIITCPPDSYGACIAGKCPIRIIKVTPAYSERDLSDSITYQYVS